MSQDFDRDLFFLLHDVARLSRVEADKRARTNGMTRAQWGILLRLSRAPGSSQKELADLLEVEPISVARLVDRLEASGLVQRRADDQDRRIWRLHLLPAATSMLATINRQREELANFVANGITPQMREVMVDGLTRMKANLLQSPPAHAVPTHYGSAAPGVSTPGGAKPIFTDVLERQTPQSQEKI
jgi:DNA-binding MarR family transcriptional regulator